MSKALTKVVDGWSVTMDGDEPWVLDEELGIRLGFSEPRFIRKLIRSLLRRKFLSDSEVRAVASQTSEKGGRPGVAYLLNETGALLVILRSDTKIAHLITRQLVEVCKTARRDQVSPRQSLAVSIPVPQNGPTIGDSAHKRETIKKLCKSAAGHVGETVHRVQGVLRARYSASGVYQIPEVHYPDLRDRLLAWIDGDEAWPSNARRQLKAAANDDRQCDLPLAGIG